MTGCDTCPQFPAENTGLGGAANTSPLIRWSGAAPETTSFVVLLVDLANDLTHWAVWGIPAGVTELPAALPQGADLTGDLAGAHQQSYSGTQYVGSGACNHVYEFRVYALTEPLSASTREAVRTEVESSTAAMAFVRLRSDWMDGCTPHIGDECP
jgi:phosphatidylethanolamine-binding protein (PEBP) family uncharacterized protein